MLPALERRIQLVSEPVYQRRLELSVRRALRVHSIPEYFFQAFFRIPRLEVMRFFFRVMDEQVTVDQRIINGALTRAAQGDAVPVYYNADTQSFLSTTSLSLMIHMAALVEPEASYDGTRVLVVGSGTGVVPYALATLGADVTGVEINEGMVDLSRQLLERYDRQDVPIVQANAARWIESQGDFDAILIFAAVAPGMVSRFTGHLDAGARLVLPIGIPDRSWLTCFTRSPDGTDIREDRIIEVSFIPFIAPENHS